LTIIEKPKKFKKKKIAWGEFSDSLFFCSKVTVYQWSISDQKIIRDFPKVMDSHIWAMATTPDNQTLFIGDASGNLKQIDLGDFETLWDYSKIVPGGINSLLVTPDSSHLFASDEAGNLKKISIARKKIISNLTQPIKSGICKMVITFDRKNLFVAGFNGELLKICTQTLAILDTYEPKGEGLPITSLAVSTNNHHLITVTNAKKITKFCVSKLKVLKEFGGEFLGAVYAIGVAPGDSGVFVLGDKKLRLVSLIDGRIIYEFDPHGGMGINQMVIVDGGRYLFTGEWSGGLTQWDVKDRCAVKDWRKVIDGNIWLLCY
jgi:WD40 repeat protein